MSSSVVKRHEVGAAVYEPLDVALGIGYHEVRVEEQLAERANILDHLEPERQVGNEHAVHNVDVDPIGAYLAHVFYFVAHSCEVAAQYRRRYLYCAHALIVPYATNFVKDFSTTLERRIKQEAFPVGEGFLRKKASHTNVQGIST